MTPETLLVTNLPFNPFGRERVHVGNDKFPVHLRRLFHHDSLLHCVFSNVHISCWPNSLDLNVRHPLHPLQQRVSGEVLGLVLITVKRTGRLSRNTLSSSSPDLTVSAAFDEARRVRWMCKMAGMEWRVPYRYIEPVEVPSRQTLVAL